jgi:hypothetical protein
MNEVTIYGLLLGGFVFALGMMSAITQKSQTPKTIEVSRELHEKYKHIYLQHEAWGAAQAHYCDAWLQAELEFDLPDEDAYACIKRLLAEIESLKTVQ